MSNMYYKHLMFGRVHLWGKMLVSGNSDHIEFVKASLSSELSFFFLLKKEGYTVRDPSNRYQLATAITKHHKEGSEILETLLQSEEARKEPEGKNAKGKNF